MNNGKYEYVANTYSSTEGGDPTTNSYNGALTRADARYVNKYFGSKHSITGDGLIDTDGWGGNTDWLSTSYPVFERGSSGLFGYYSYDGDANSNYSARAVVVCGSGL